MKHAVTIALLALLLSSVSLAADDPEGPDWGFTPLDQIDLGEQLVGERVTHYDLRGRVVLLYTWGITCPISTGAFPAVNGIVNKYRDRGVVVVGFQCRRNPDVKAENVQWYLNHLRPNFPVCRLGDDWEWPARILPWGLLYDHEGKQIYAGSLGGIGAKIDAALAKAPHWLIGGPYAKLGDLPAKILNDRENIREHLHNLIDLTKGEGETAAEATALKNHLKRWFDWQMAKAEEMHSPVDAKNVYLRLGAMFGDHTLGIVAGIQLKKITGRKGFAAEAAGHEALRQARLAFRLLPPAGRYAYNMDYSEVTDATVLATRGRILAAFRADLTRIVAEYPKSVAASDAEDLLFEHDMPFIEDAAAEKRLADAEGMLGKENTPFERYDAYLLLHQIEEGYFGEGDIAAKAKAMLVELRKNVRALAAASAAHREFTRIEAGLRDRVRRGGSALLRADADAIIEELAKLAKSCGRKSLLSKRTMAFIEALERSYGGPANLGVYFDRRWRDAGARVQYVYPSSAASRDGLMVGDVILKVSGKPVESSATAEALLSEHQPGGRVKIEVRRGRGDDAKTVTVEVTLGRKI